MPIQNNRLRNAPTYGGPVESRVHTQAAQDVIERQPSRWEKTGAWSAVALSSTASLIFAYGAAKAATRGCSNDAKAYATVAALMFVAAAIHVKQAVGLGVEVGLHQPA